MQHRDSKISPEVLAKLQSMQSGIRPSVSGKSKGDDESKDLSPVRPLMTSSQSEKNLLSDKLSELQMTEEISSHNAIESIRISVKRFISTHWAGHLYEFILLLLSILSPLQYVFGTYLENDYTERGRNISLYFDFVEMILAAIFTFDWVLAYFLADHKIIFITSFFSMVDLMTVVPIWVQMGTSYISHSQIHSFRDAIVYLLQATQTTRILRALRIRKRVINIEDEVDKCFAEIVLTISVMILFNSALIRYLELETVPLPFHTWMYYMWVTLATVGYGDITPHSDLGRYAAMSMIAIAIILIPKMSNELIDKMQLQSIYARLAYRPRTKNSSHVLICGEIESMASSEFFAELFHEDHDNDNLHAVILQPKRPSFEMIMMMRDPIFLLQVTYLEGSALLEKDLKRALAEKALAIFIMTNKYGLSPDKEDAKSILQQLSIVRYLQSDPTRSRLFCMQLIRPENKRHLYSADSNDESNVKTYCVCLNELQMGVIAKASMYPGINTLIMNLLCSFADDDDNDAINTNTDTENVDEDEMGNWIGEYQRGCDWEIYMSELSPIFEGVTFSVLADSLYQKLGIVLFGLQVEDAGKEGSSKQIYLNPSKFIIPSSDDSKYLIQAIVLAKNKASSDLRFEHNDHTAHSIIGSAFGLASYAAQQVGKQMTKLKGASNESDGSEVAYVTNHKTGAGKNKKTLAWQHLIRRFEKSGNGASQTVEEERQSNFDKYFSDNFYLAAEQPQDLASCTVNSLADELSVVEDHTIIIGKNVINIFDLIRPLRAKESGPLQYIVILYPYDFPPDIWMKISVFEGIFIVRGSALEENDLRRAGVFKARSVIVLADAGKDVQSASVTESTAESEALLDADAIFCYHCVRKMNETARIIVEITNVSNVGYLDPESGLAAGDVDYYKFSSQFACGNLFTSSLLDTIVCQAFYNTQVISVVNELVGNSDINEITQNQKRNKGALRSSLVYQIPVPEGLESRTYGALFKYLTERNKIPLGIYRGIFPHMKLGPKSNKMSYVFTNPPKDTELFSCDRFFILSQEPVKIKTDYSKLIKEETRDKEISYLRSLRLKRNIVQTTATLVEGLQTHVSKLEERLDHTNQLLTNVNASVDSKIALVMSALKEINGDKEFKVVKQNKGFYTTSSI